MQNSGTIKLTLTDIAANKSGYTGGKITVSNAADLGGILRLTIRDGKLNKGEQTGKLQLISASSFTGEFLETLANNLYAVSPEGNGKYVISVKKSAEDLIFDANGTPNNVRTGIGWNKADGLQGTAKKVRDVLDDLAQHDAAGYIGALNALAPSDSRKKVQIVSEIGGKIFAEIDKRQQTGRSGGDSAEGMWGRVFGGYSKQDASAENNGFSAKTMGFAVGVDGEAGTDAAIGAGYAFAAAKADGDGKDTDVETHTAFVYGKYQPSDWFVRGAFRFGGGKFHEKANVGGVEVKAGYTVFHAGAQAFGGYLFGNGVAPQAGLRYTLVSQRKYTDSVGQRVGSDTVGVLTAVAGADGIASSGKIGSFDLSVKAHAAVTYDLTAGDSKSDVRLGDGGYLIVGKRLSRFGAQAGAGLSARRGAWLFGLDCDADFKRDYFSGVGMLTLQYFL